MSSSSPACLSGRANYRSLESLNLDVIIKSPPSSNSWLSNSPSSTLSESSNCPSHLFAISTRKKPRTPRKRPNQTYNEAAKILSTAHPKIFPLTKFTKKSHYHTTTSSNNINYKTNNINSIFLFDEPTSDLLMLDHPPPHLDRSHFSNPKAGFFNLFEKSCESPGEMEINSSSCFSEICDDIDYFQENFDAESILDEEIGDQGIDSIMGSNLSTENNNIQDQSHVDDTNYSYSTSMNHVESFCYGYPVIGLDGYGLMRREMKAMKSSVDDDWWRFPSHVNMLDIITPQINDSQQNNFNAKILVEKKKKKKKNKKNIVVAENNNSNLAPKAESFDDQPVAKTNIGGLLLKLNYDGVLNEWSDKGSPFSGDAPGAETAGNDVQARLAQIDLFLENGGVREASVLRYKEKRRNRLFSKKIRYQVRKVNADRRPRMKGRFVRTPNSPDD